MSILKIDLVSANSIGIEAVDVGHFYAHIHSKLIGCVFVPFILWICVKTWFKSGITKDSLIIEGYIYPCAILVSTEFLRHLEALLADSNI